MTADVKQILTDVIDGRKSGYIFVKSDGKPISTGSVNSQFSRLRSKYNFIDETVEGKVDLHSLRHTFATMCIEAGMDANTLKTLLGHTDIRITMNTYADVFAAHRDTQMDKLTEYMKQTGIAFNSDNNIDVSELENKSKYA